MIRPTYYIAVYDNNVMVFPREEVSMKTSEPDIIHGIDMSDIEDGLNTSIGLKEERKESLKEEPSCEEIH